MSATSMKLARKVTVLVAGDRGLEYNDRPAIKEIVRRTEAADYRLQDMIIAVCEGVPMQRMLPGK